MDGVENEVQGKTGDKFIVEAVAEDGKRTTVAYIDTGVPTCMICLQGYDVIRVDGDTGEVIRDA